MLLDETVVVQGNLGNDLEKINLLKMDSHEDSKTTLLNDDDFDKLQTREPYNQQYNDCISSTEEKEEADLQELLAQADALQTNTSSALSKSRKHHKQNDRGEKKLVQSAVWVTSLPADCTVDELELHMSKAGLIMQDMTSGGPRIHLHSAFESERRDPSENNNGIKHRKDTIILEGECEERDCVSGKDASDSEDNNALVVYLRPESVQLAVTLLDGSILRPAHPDSRISVQPAPQQKHHLNNSSSSNKPAIDRQVWIKKMTAMKRQLDWWEEDTPGDTFDGNGRRKIAAVTAITRKLKKLCKKERKEDEKGSSLVWVLLDNLYDEEDGPEELERGLREECAAKGFPCSRVMVCEDRKQVKVAFESQADAMQCIAVINGRRYAGRMVATSLINQNFHESRQPACSDDGTSGSEERLDKFGAWLEEQYSSDISSDFEKKQ